MKNLSVGLLTAMLTVSTAHASEKRIEPRLRTVQNAHTSYLTSPSGDEFGMFPMPEDRDALIATRKVISSAWHSGSGFRLRAPAFARAQAHARKTPQVTPAPLAVVPRSLDFARDFGCGLPPSLARRLTPAKRLKLLPLTQPFMPRVSLWLWEWQWLWG